MSFLQPTLELTRHDDSFLLSSQLNLLLSLIYNVVSIPLAAGVFYPLVRTRVPPTLAALAMALSSVGVVCSSLALRFYQPPAISTTVAGRRQQRGSSSRRQAMDNQDLTQPLLDPDPTERASNLSEMEEGQILMSD